MTWVHLAAEPWLGNATMAPQNDADITDEVKRDNRNLFHRYLITGSETETMALGMEGTYEGFYKNDVTPDGSASVTTDGLEGGTSHVHFIDRNYFDDSFFET